MINHYRTKTVEERESEMIFRAQAQVLSSARWFTGTELLKRIECVSTDPKAQLIQWLSEKKLFSIASNGVELYPMYALDIANHYLPVQGLQPVLKTFGDTKNDWGLAYWFSANNGFLGGARPQNLLTTDPERVLAAAKDELLGVQHG
jgi:hypothetical protein